MRILSLDTSSDILSVAVFDGTKELASYESASNRHSETLLPALQKTLKVAGLDLGEIDCIAVGLGPGSFTGLRIGVTTAKMLSYVLKKKLIGVLSLEAMARSEDRDGIFAVMTDAKKSQVYAAQYRRKNGQWKLLQKPAIFLKEDFVKSLKPGAVVLDSAQPTASAIARAALERVREKKFDDPFLIKPFYLHPKDCNVSRK